MKRINLSIIIYNINLIIMINKENIKNYKLHLLQNRYVKITELIINLERHIILLKEKNYITNIKKNVILGKLFEISKCINTKYNNYINNEMNLLEKNIIDEKFNELFKKTNDNNSFHIIEQYYNFENNNKKPLEYTYQEIKELISNYGYNSLKDIIQISINNNVKLFDSSVKNLINELEDIVIPLSYETFDVKKKKNILYYWRIPEKFDDNDYFEQIRELWIKKPNTNNKFIKIKLFFKIDTLSVRIKTCQINFPILYDIKNKNINELEKNHSNIDKKFIKSLVKHDYLGNIYCMNIKEYISYIKLMYYKKLELSENTFLSLMKEFISKKKIIKEMFLIIYLLLLGSNESADLSSLLLGLIKEKKNINNELHKHIYNNLTYFLQVKIKKSDNDIKNEINKLKSLSTEDIDYKKQLLTNKFIPNNIKSLTLEKVEEMKSFNNEYYKQLTYVKNIIQFPWPSNNDDIFYKKLNNNHNEAITYLNDVENKLKNSSYGHEEAKKVLLQIIGKWISNPSSRGTCFGLVGPPGVGKTLLAKSVSNALNIPFGQITLGGQNDGEILHGHGYTYSGSQPGMIIKKMVEMGKSRCILYFDELDKACSKHGNINEITSILIHLTDPNMNKTFQDRFFQGVDFPLDKVIMIFSYNDSKLIDPILLDRLKEIKVNPYTTNDKLHICNNFIIPEITKNIGFNKNNVKFNKNIIEFLIDNYTHEAGVRGIKRMIENIYLQLNLDKIYNRGIFKNKNYKKILINKKDITNILSEPDIENTKIHQKNEIGIINGLYATTNGDGGIIPIQIFKNYSSEKEKFEIKLTGNQGNVMKESVQCSLTAALDYIRKNIKKYKKINNLDNYINENFKYGFHVHAPSTSTPKDGPSAGCAFTSAFISRILNKKIKNNIGMTGEIELTGKITKIGGLNYKLIGAKKAGCKLIFVPLENKSDLDKIIKKNPKLIDNKFNVEIFDNISDVINKILI
jgi:endopeptidase La